MGNDIQLTSENITKFTDFDKLEKILFKKNDLVNISDDLLMIALKINPCWIRHIVKANILHKHVFMDQYRWTINKYMLLQNYRYSSFLHNMTLKELWLFHLNVLSINKFSIDDFINIINFVGLSEKKFIDDLATYFIIKLIIYNCSKSNIKKWHKCFVTYNVNVDYLTLYKETIRIIDNHSTYISDVIYNINKDKYDECIAYCIYMCRNPEMLYHICLNNPDMIKHMHISLLDNNKLEIIMKYIKNDELFRSLVNKIANRLTNNMVITIKERTCRPPNEIYKINV